MTLLDRLLPKNWQTQVASTFGPKRFPKLSQSEFTPGLGGSEPYDKYTDFLNQGLQLTEEGYDFYTGQKKAGTDWGEVWESLIGGYGGEDPTEYFSKYWFQRCLTVFLRTLLQIIFKQNCLPADLCRCYYCFSYLSTLWRD